MAVDDNWVGIKGCPEKKRGMWNIYLEGEGINVNHVSCEPGYNTNMNLTLGKTVQLLLHSKHLLHYLKSAR